MRKIKQIISCFLLIMCGSLFCHSISHAAEEDTYGIHIVKYKLEEGIKLNHSLPHNGVKVDQVTDEKGNILQHLEGVSYEITKVSIKSGSTDSASWESYEVIDDIQIEIITNDEGVAEVNGLTEGTYLVKEIMGEGLKDIMEPVLVQLPLNNGGSIVKDVYIYPKSSVVSLKDTPTNLPPTSTKRLPQTSGNIGTVTQILWMIVLIILMGVFGLSVSKRRNG